MTGFSRAFGIFQKMTFWISGFLDFLGFLAISWQRKELRIFLDLSTKYFGFFDKIVWICRRNFWICRRNFFDLSMTTTMRKMMRERWRERRRRSLFCISQQIPGGQRRRSRGGGGGRLRRSLGGGGGGRWQGGGQLQ